MASRTVRRRLHHGDVGGGRYDRFEASESDSLNEPLLAGCNDDDDRRSKAQLLVKGWDDERHEEHLHWALLFSHLIAQWAQWSANIVLGTGSVIGRFIPFISTIENGGQSNRNRPPILLSSLQEARLKHLKRSLVVPFDSGFQEHQDALRQLWSLAYPGRTLPPLKSELWKEMGWQGSDPSTDFRKHFKFYCTKVMEIGPNWNIRLLWLASIFHLCWCKCWIFSQEPPELQQGNASLN